MSASSTSKALRTLRPVLDPERIAVVGASSTLGSPGSVIWRNLSGFPGERIPVTPTSREIDGVAAYPSLRDVPGRIDLAVVAVPARAVPEVVRDAVSAGVGACVIVSAGFSETGDEGAALERDLTTAARAGGVLLVGPNCLGVQNCDVPMNASFSSGLGGGPSSKLGGGISLITQSGSYAMAIHGLSADEGVRFAVAYSSGNHCDVDDAEVIEYLREDPRTRVICAFVESIGDGETLLEVARRTTREKPLIAATVGGSEAGSRAAASHTAALAADRRAWADVLASVGITVTGSGLEMLDAARVLSSQPVPRGRRAAIVTNSGGTGVELADLLAQEGIEVPELSDELRQRLAPLLPAHASTANPVDVTPVWMQFADIYPKVITELARSGEVELVIPVLLHRSAENADVAIAVADAVRELRSQGNEVPVYACWVARREAWPVTRYLHEADIPCLEWPARTARAVGHAVRYGRYRREVVRESVPSSPAPSELPVRVGRDVTATAEFLLAQGISVVATHACATVEEAVNAAEQVGLPVVAKVDHASISHKTESGGVRLGLDSAPEVAVAARELLALADGARVLIQPQASGVELVVGGIRDATFGPIVAFGLGGIFVEALDSASFAAAPVSDVQAEALVRGIRGGIVLSGFRGTPPADVPALVRLVRAVGDIMCAYPQIQELDLNPVLAGPFGAIAVDVRLVRV